MEDLLNILWTSSDPVTGRNMVLMYASNAAAKKWWNRVRIIIWGGSTKLIGEDEGIQRLLQVAIESGVEVSACRACADDLGVVPLLESLGIEVKYWGADLTKILKNEGKLLTV